MARQGSCTLGRPGLAWGSRPVPSVTVRVGEGIGVALFVRDLAQPSTRHEEGRVMGEFSPQIAALGRAIPACIPPDPVEVTR